MRDLLRRVGEAFALEGDFEDGRAHGSGHIHETFVARFGSRRFLLQRLNTRIFRDPAAVMENLSRVTQHLRSRLRAAGVADVDRRCLRPLTARDGVALWVDAEGGCWRVFPFVDGARSFDTIEGPEQARAAARAFGAFAACLADLPGPPLAVTIPDFHDLDARFRQLDGAARTDPVGRARAVVAELERARALHRGLEAALAGISLSALPRRSVHHDCKLNNLLFDESTGEALCVIDLDTVMPGSLLSDFGELVRTGSCRAPEDETDLTAIRVDDEVYRALTRGYIEGVGEILTPREADLLPLAPVLLALMNGVRFLADHLAGDVYFPAHREGHNLDRARAQLQLAGRLAEGQGAARDSVAAALEAGVRV